MGKDKGVWESKVTEKRKERREQGVIKGVARPLMTRK